VFVLSETPVGASLPSFAAVTLPSTIFAVVTVPSLGVPIANGVE
jgi:hypothetical protein